uniref:Uncharacterized protein n=1 Tax=Ascaris lumbricoides TaxID=6252 RepID=A0A0M3HHJ6_ASCLU
MLTLIFTSNKFSLEILEIRFSRKALARQNGRRGWRGEEGGGKRMKRLCTKLVIPEPFLHILIVVVACRNIFLFINNERSVISEGVLILYNISDENTSFKGLIDSRHCFLTAEIV